MDRRSVNLISALSLLHFTVTSWIYMQSNIVGVGFEGNKNNTPFNHKIEKNIPVAGLYKMTR